MSAQSPTKDAGATDDGHAGDALHQFISFAIGDDQYGVDIMAVREIKGWSQINPLPGQPDYMRGVLNLRGAMVPIVDLRCRFGQGMTEATPLHVVIVTQISGRPIGLLADQVLDIVDVEPARIQPVPSHLPRRRRPTSCPGWSIIDSGMVALIDLPRLLTVSMADGATLETGTQHAAASPPIRAEKRGARFSGAPLSFSVFRNIIWINNPALAVGQRLNRSVTRYPYPLTYGCQQEKAKTDRHRQPIARDKLPLRHHWLLRTAPPTSRARRKPGRFVTRRMIKFRQRLAEAWRLPNDQ